MVDEGELVGSVRLLKAVRRWWPCRGCVRGTEGSRDGVLRLGPGAGAVTVSPPTGGFLSLQWVSGMVLGWQNPGLEPRY